MRKINTGPLLERSRFVLRQNRLLAPLVGIALAACVVLAQTTTQVPAAPGVQHGVSR